VRSQQSEVSTVTGRPQVGPGRPTPRTRTRARGPARTGLRTTISPQALLLAFVVGWAVVEPYYGVRVGGAIAALLILTRIHTFRTRRTDAWLTGFMVLYLGANLWSPFPDQSWSTTTGQISAILIFLAIRAVCATRAEFKVVALGVLGGCAYALVNLWQIRGLLSSGAYDAYTGLTTDVNDYTESLLGANKNYLAYGLTMGIVVVFILWAGSSRRTLLRLAVAVAPLMLGIYFIGARGAQLAVLLVAAWVLVQRFMPPAALSVLAVTLSGGLLALASGILDDEVTPQQVTGRETGTLNSRLLMWPIARSLIAERPWGWGPGTFTELNLFGIVTHNAILEIGVGLGLLGIVLYLGTLYSVLFHDTREVPGRQRLLVVGVTMCAFAPILASGHWDQAGPGWTVLGLVSVLGVWLGADDAEESESPGPFEEPAPSAQTSGRSPSQRARGLPGGSNTRRLLHTPPTAPGGGSRPGAHGGKPVLSS
jgi:O-antigen ligase